MSGETHLYLVRHGESEANAARVFTGQTDSPLTERGREQARTVARVLAPIHFDRIASSDLSRTRDTAEVIASGRGIPVETYAGLREIDLGRMAGRGWDEARGLPNYDSDGFVQWPGGESLEQVLTRALSVIDTLVHESSGKTICVVGHGGVTRILVSNFFGVLPKLIRTTAQNTNVTVAVHDGAGYRVESLFDDAHLP
ncbi:MAG: histidine phosphatase family protein [Chloroflexi bacterium]|nr:histidine phosphatase family protein [Chloroflexota bacterium]